MGAMKLGPSSWLVLLMSCAMASATSCWSAVPTPLSPPRVKGDLPAAGDAFDEPPPTTSSGPSNAIPRRITKRRYPTRSS